MDSGLAVCEMPNEASRIFGRRLGLLTEEPGTSAQPRGRCWGHNFSPAGKGWLPGSIVMPRTRYGGGRPDLDRRDDR